MSRARRKAPDVFEYEDAREYLRAWRAMESVRSIRWLAEPQRLGCATSTVHALLQERSGSRGQMISPRYLEPWIAVMGLEGDAAEYFRQLVYAEESPFEEERVRAAREAGRIRRAKRAVQGASTNAHLLEWYYFAILELAKLPGFQSDPVWIARQLRPNLPPDLVQRAVNHLLEAGALRETSPGTYETTHGDIQFTPAQAPAEFAAAMRSWHQWFVERAPAALEEFSASERDFSALVVSVPEHRWAEVQALISATHQRILFLCGPPGTPAEAGSTRVYVVSTQAFPVTAAVPTPRSPRP